jgi:hypothetical protein
MTQIILRQNHVTTVGNEDSSMFTKPDRSLRMDTVIYPGGMLNCGNSKLQHKGFLIDSCVKACTSNSFLKGRENAATIDGFAAAAGELAKQHTYDGWYPSRYQLVPVVQETGGRLGRLAATILKDLATHSAQCKGGSLQQIARRRPYILASIRTQLTTCLARELAEVAFAYVRAAGRRFFPVSALLSLAGE